MTKHTAQAAEMNSQAASAAGINARDLVKTFRDGTVRALGGIDIQIDRGDMTAIVGPSGGGKSTLLYALSGLIGLDRGSVEICGRTPASAADWAMIRSTRIGLVFQEDWLLPNLTAAENIELPMLGVETDQAAKRQRIDWLLDEVNANGLGDRMPASLSGGERQRIAIARGLANNPQFLLADEPTGELDSENSEAIITLLTRLRDEEGLTVIIVTHDRQIAARCGRHFRVRDGKGHYVD